MTTQNSAMSDEDQQMYVFANNPEGHQLLHTFKQLLRKKGEDAGLIAIVKGVLSRDQQIALAARVDERKRAAKELESYVGREWRLPTDFRDLSVEEIVKRCVDQTLTAQAQYQRNAAFALKQAQNKEQQQ